jgi:thymidylate synthase
MQPIYIEATTLEDCWFKMLEACVEKGRKYTVQIGSYAGQQRQELDFVTARIKYPGSRPLVPEINPGLGIPPPVTMQYVEEEYLPYLLDPSIKKDTEEYIYAEYIAPQLPRVTQMLIQGSNTNQACISVGDANSINQEDPACLRLLQFRVIDGVLNLFVVFRSNDLFNAWPGNLAAIQLMKEMVAMDTNLEDGEIIYTSPGLHLYDFSWDIAKLRVAA